MGTSGLGSLLVEEGLLTEKDRRTIRRSCGHEGASFAKSVLALGLLTEDELASFLAKRTPHRIAAKDIAKEASNDAFGALDRPLIERLEVVPLKLNGQTLTVAMVDPLDQDTVRQLEFFSGYKITPVIATYSQIRLGLTKLMKDFKPKASHLEEFLAKHASAATKRLAGLEGTKKGAAKTAVPSAPKQSKPTPKKTMQKAAELSHAAQHQPSEDDGLEYPSEVSGGNDPFEDTSDSLEMGDTDLTASMSQAAESANSTALEELEGLDALTDINATDVFDSLSAVGADEDLGASAPSGGGSDAPIDEKENDLDDHVETESASNLQEAQSDDLEDLAGDLFGDDFPGGDQKASKPGISERDEKTDLSSDDLSSLVSQGDQDHDNIFGAEAAADLNSNVSPEEILNARGNTAAGAEHILGSNDDDDLDAFMTAEPQIEDSLSAAKTEPPTLASDDDLELGGDDLGLGGDDLELGDDDLQLGGGDDDLEAGGEDLELGADEQAIGSEDLTLGSDDLELGFSESKSKGHGLNQTPPYPIAEDKLASPIHSEAADDLFAPQEADLELSDDLMAMPVATLPPLQEDSSKDDNLQLNHTTAMHIVAGINRALLKMTMAKDRQQAASHAATAFNAAGVNNGIFYRLVGSAFEIFGGWNTVGGSVLFSTFEKNAAYFSGVGLSQALQRLPEGWQQLKDGSRDIDLKSFEPWLTGGKSLMAATVAGKGNADRVSLIGSFDSLLMKDEAVSTASLDLLKQLARRV